MSKVYFLLGIHNHQPVGNFLSVIETAYNTAYKPFLDTLYNYPEVKFSLHCSGILWDYFLEHHPEYIEKLKEMVTKGQVELISGGYYEPILSSIPQKDRIGQIKMMNEFLFKTFGIEPKGLWLTERIWEQNIVKDISSTGIKYTLTDDYHFFSSGVPKQELTGYYITDEEGETLYIFPISQTLRYYIPFKPVNEVINFFRQFSTGPAGTIVSLTMGDDGEKFGVWPKTYQHVYTDGWLVSFLEKLKENKDWLFTTTFSEFISLQPVKGKVYLPTSSYFEMGEWTLPQQTQELFEDILKELQTLPQKDKYFQFFRGGYWKNFFAKYSESNHMHKKMLYVSKKVKNSSQETVKNLYKSQCNCAYWHGVFGGLYLPHLREAIYEHLIKSEKEIFKKNNITITDFDKDGKEDIIIETEHWNVYINPSYGGSVTEIDVKKFNKNLLNVLTRRKEAYHRKLIELEQQTHSTDPSKIKTIHDLVLSKEPNLNKYLFYDWYTRYSFLVHFLHPDTKYENFYKSQFGECGDFTIEPFNIENIDKKTLNVTLSRSGHIWKNDKRYPVKVVKQFEFISPEYIKCEYTIENLSEKQLSLWFLTQLNLMVVSPGTEHIGEFVTDRYLVRDNNFSVEIIVPEKSLFWIFPIETISLSEGGFERTYQGLCIAPNFKFVLSPKEKFITEMVLNIK